MQGNNKGVRLKDLNSKEIALGKNKPTKTWIIWSTNIFALQVYAALGEHPVDVQVLHLIIESVTFTKNKKMMSR